MTSSLGTSSSTLGGAFVLGLSPADDSGLDPFSVDPGVDAGRIAPDPDNAGIRLDGSSVFCLGHDRPGLMAFMAPGDYVEVSQSANVNPSLEVGFSPRSRPPTVYPPAGYGWKISILVDGAEASSRTIFGSLPEDWAAWTLNVSKLSNAAHLFAFRLTFVGPTLPGPPALPMLEVEIPAFYIEAVTATSPSDSPLPRITNLVPEPNDGIGGGNPPPVTTAIDLEFVNYASGAVTTHPTVTVNAVNAMVNGVAQTGWTSSTIVTTGDTTRVHLVPTVPFTSSELVNVVAKTQEVPGSNRSWSFRIADVQPPTIASIVARGTKLLRATWDEAVEELSTTGAHDATNPALYTLAPNITIGGVVPAVSPIVTSVAIVSSTIVDLTTDVDVTPGVDYTLTAIGVNDVVGNHTTSTSSFASFVPPQPAGRDFDLWSRLPLINRAEDVTQDLRRFVACIQEVADLLLYDVDRWTDILDVDIADEEYLDAMLEDLGNPFPFVLTVDGKRRLLHTLISIYQQKGTENGIVNVVRFFLGLTVTVTTFLGTDMLLGESLLGVDWILGPGTSFARYAFRVVAEVTLTPTQRSEIFLLVNYMKPAHTHFVELVEPFAPPTYDPMVLGVSQLGVDWSLH